jgi:hypothetical protein
LGQFSKNYRKKIVKKLLKIWSWDPGSGKNLSRIPDPGVKKHPIPDPGSGSATLVMSSVPDPDLMRPVDPDSELGVESRRAKMTHKNRKSSEISCFEVLDVFF